MSAVGFQTVSFCTLQIRNSPKINLKRSYASYSGSWVQGSHARNPGSTAVNSNLATNLTAARASLPVKHFKLSSLDPPNTRSHAQD